MRVHWRELAGVAAVFGVTFAYLAAQALRMKTYVWMVDELLYTKAAQSFAADPLHTEVFGHSHNVPNALYARLLAVPYGLLSSLHAFSAGHALNALLFASASVPVYLLGRRLGATHLWSLVGAALAVWVPWAVAVLVLMSESAAYPAFAWAVLAGVVAIAEPRPRNDLLLILALVVLVYSRTQFVVVLPAFAIALVVHEISWPARARGDFTARARAHWLLGTLLATAFLSWLVIRPAFLGDYARTTQIPRFPAGLLDSMGDHLTHFVLGVGVAPALLFGVALVRGASAPVRREQHVFAYLAGLSALLLTYQAGFYSRQIAGGHLQERYILYLAAILAAGTALVLSDVPPRVPLGTLLACTAVLIPMAGVALFPPEVSGVFTLESAASGFNRDIVSIHDSLIASWTVAGMVAALIGAVAVVVAAALFEHRWRRFTVPALGVAILIFCVFETGSLFRRVVPEVNGAVSSTLGNPPKAWVDGLLFRGDEKAGAIEGPLDAPQLWLWTEFWNARVQRVYTPPGRVAASGLPATPLAVDRASGRIQTEAEMPMLVVSAGDPALKVRGDTVRTVFTGQRLVRPARPYRADFVYGDGGATAVGRDPTELCVYPPAADVRTARVTLTFVQTAAKPARAQVVAAGKRWTGEVRRGGGRRVAVPLTLAPGEARGVLTISAPGSDPKSGMSLSQVAVAWQ